MNMSSPIENLGSIDVVGVRNDGGLDLVISCAGPLDGSKETLWNLERKILNYLGEIREAKNPSLLESYGCSPDAKVSILIAHDPPIDPNALAVIQQMREVASAEGVQLLMDDRSESET